MVKDENLTFHLASGTDGILFQFFLIRFWRQDTQHELKRRILQDLKFLLTYSAVIVVQFFEILDSKFSHE